MNAVEMDNVVTEARFITNANIVNNDINQENPEVETTSKIVVVTDNGCMQCNVTDAGDDNKETSNSPISSISKEFFVEDEEEDWGEVNDSLSSETSNVNIDEDDILVSKQKMLEQQTKRINSLNKKGDYFVKQVVFDYSKKLKDVEYKAKRLVWLNYSLWKTFGLSNENIKVTWHLSYKDTPIICYVLDRVDKLVRAKFVACSKKSKHLYQVSRNVFFLVPVSVDTLTPKFFQRYEKDLGI